MWTVVKQKLKINDGFTLIELSIVLVIIGLIIGGVLVGQDLINAATIRAQIAQMEKYNTAVHTFQLKYGYLPGDITAQAASSFGFAPRTGGSGSGNGDGILTSSFNSCSDFQTGENVLFWVDLSTSNLIDQTLNTATYNSIPTTAADVPKYLPKAKIGNNYIEAWGATCPNSPSVVYSFSYANYFTIANTTVFFSGWGAPKNLAGLSVNQAYAIDSKIDDGLPTSGTVTTQLISCAAGGCTGTKSNGNGTIGGANFAGWDTFPNSPSATSCIDNNGLGGAYKYSITQNNGTGINCALSFNNS